MRHTIQKYAAAGLRETSMSDPYWPTVLARIWKNVKVALEDDTAAADSPAAGKVSQVPASSLAAHCPPSRTPSQPPRRDRV